MSKGLSPKLLEEISRTAAQTALEYLEKEKRKQEKIKYDRRLRNVKLLLRNYRSLVQHVANIKLEINELDEKLELDDLDTDGFRLESIKRSKERTLAMVKYINKMLSVYKVICEQTGNQEDLRRYQVIYDLYISENKKTVKEIAEGHFMHYRSVYKDVDNACKTLVVLMFGVDGINGIRFN